MPPERKRPQDDDNNDEGIKVIPFKKQDVEAEDRGQRRGSEDYKDSS